MTSLSNGKNKSDTIYGPDCMYVVQGETKWKIICLIGYVTSDVFGTEIKNLQLEAEQITVHNVLWYFEVDVYHSTAIEVDIQVWKNLRKRTKVVL